MKFLAITALLVTLATQSFAQTCGPLCSFVFLNTATPQEIEAGVVVWGTLSNIMPCESNSEALGHE